MERSQCTRPDWTAYTDGGCKDEQAGWGYVLTEEGDGVEDWEAKVVDEGYGPVVVEEGHPAYIGATKASNNTGELSAVAELLRALLEEQARPPESSGVIRTDSEVAAAIMTGRAIAQENRQLASTVRNRWQRLRARHGKRVLWRHVKGHSGHKFNDRADELAEKGRMGEVCARGEAWEQAQPLEQPTLVRREGCFAFAAERRLSLRVERGEWQVRVRTEVDASSLHWVSAGGMPQVNLSTIAAGDEARAAVRAAIDQVQMEGGERTIGTPNRIALFFPPQITEESEARRGAMRAEERMSAASIVYRWGASREHARAVWHVAARLMPLEVFELGAAWCTGPTRAARAGEEEEPELQHDEDASESPAEPADTCIDGENEREQQHVQAPERADATADQAQAAGTRDTEPEPGNTEAVASPLARAEARYARAVAEAEANYELTSDDGAGVFDDLGERRSTADARAQVAEELYLVEIAEAQKSLQTRADGAEEEAEVSEEEAVAAEAVEAQQQQEERITAEAAQAPVQQGEYTKAQQQEGDITVQQEHAAEPHAAAARPSTGEHIANFAQQIKAVASSAVQKMHSISAHASIWWKKRRRSSAENANRSAEATGNEIYQHVEEAASAAAAAARTEQPGARSTTRNCSAEQEARTQKYALASEIAAEERFTVVRHAVRHAASLRITPDTPSSTAPKSKCRMRGTPSWSFGGRSWKARAKELFTAPSWGIKEPMEVEMGATLYRTHRRRAERSGEAGQPRPRTSAQPPAPRGGEHPHSLRGVGAGTDGPREGPGQLARTSGPVNPIADPGQKGSKDTAPKIRN